MARANRHDTDEILPLMHSKPMWPWLTLRQEHSEETAWTVSGYTDHPVQGVCCVKLALVLDNSLLLISQTLLGLAELLSCLPNVGDPQGLWC